MLENPVTRWLPPSGKSGGADREARTPRTSWQTVPTREQAPNSALRAQIGPMRTGKILRSAPSVAHSPAPGAAGGRGRHGEGAKERGGTSAPGPPPLRTNTASRLLGSTRLPPAQGLLGRLLSIPGLVGSKWTPAAPAPLVTNPWLWALDARYSGTGQSGPGVRRGRILNLSTSGRPQFTQCFLPRQGSDSIFSIYFFFFFLAVPLGFSELSSLTRDSTQTLRS